MKKLITIIFALTLLGVGCKEEVNLGALDTSRTVEKWGGEVKLTISYPLTNGELILGASEGAELNEILYDSPDKQVKTYDIPPNDVYKNGAFEYEVIFKRKPKTNRVSFDIDSTNLEFYYQAPLFIAEKNNPELTCTATECRNKDDVLVISRPENVVDSYAVYHSNKRNHKVGGVNYKSGKAYHIYRSKIFDASGDWTWAEKMTYAKGKLTVIVPQRFLNQAVYPVTVDPNLGYDTVGGTQSINGPDNIRVNDYNDGSGYTMSEAGTASSVWFYAGGGGGVDAWKAAIYDDSGGTPNGLVDESTGADIYNATTAGWHEATGFNASLANGSIYYPAVWHDHAWNYYYVYYDDSDGDDGYYDDSQTYGAWPDPLVEGAANNVYRLYSSYIEYTTGGGGGGTPAPKKTADIIIF